VRARVLGIVFLVVSMSTAVGAAAGMTQSPSRDGKAAVMEGNPDLVKVSTHLLQARRLAAAGTAAADIAAATPSVTYAGGAPLIEIRFDELNDATVAAVETAGFRTAGAYPESGVMVGYARLDLLDDLAAFPEVAVIRPEYGATTTVGATTSQADVSINADDARAEFGVDGTGISVGVLSDTFNSTLGGSVAGSGCATTVTGMANQATGDLPASVTLLDNGGAGTDEGAGMAELITDLAPGADLMFHTAYGGEAGFAAGIDELVACGADVIVDDVYYFAEPMFQDGLIAQAAQDAVDAGIPFFSSAGNQATYGIEAGFVDSDPDHDSGAFGEDLHDFGGDGFAAVTIPSGAGVRFVLQWDQPFSGMLGAGAAVDMDLYLLRAPNPAGSVAAYSADYQGCSDGTRSGDPLEIIAYTNISGSTETLYLGVDHYCGSEDVDFRVASFGYGNNITALGFESGIFDDPQIYGHAAAEGVGAVAAVYYREIDSGGSFTGGSEINVESFSSSGGEIPIAFDAVGNRLSAGPITRFKPEIAAPDGTNTSFFGGDSDGDGFPNFFGTSAAAPHAAAVAALVLDFDPTLTPTQILYLLRSTAVDIESSGRDVLSGDGLIDARDALAGVDTLDTEAPTWPGGSAVFFSDVADTTARASWNAATDNVGVTGYRVYLDDVLQTTTAATFVNLAWFSPGVGYTVRVEAVDAVGNESTSGPEGILQTGASGSISGTIRDVAGYSVSLGHVDVFDDTFSYLWTVDASPNGAYSIDALYPGTYYLMFWNGDTEFIWDYFIEVYREQPLYKVELATPVVVGNGEHVTGIDSRLRWLYDDMFDHLFEEDIYWMGNSGITYGCNPPSNYLYCPDQNVTRGQMAAFLVRTFSLTDRGDVDFLDDDDSVFEADIERLAAAGITRGCNPPANDRYCPDQPVTRGQMAAFLVRAFGLAAGPTDLFVDDDGSVFEADIDRLATAGITRGCNPPANDRYCPDQPVTRGQMAAFLHRAVTTAASSPRTLVAPRPTVVAGSGS